MRLAIILLTAMLGCSRLFAQQEPTQPRPVRVSSGVMAGLAIKRVEPVFPREAIDAKVNGAVVCSVVIGKDGKVREATVISGPEMLRKNYLEAIRQWEWRPYLVNGQPVEVHTFITITLQIGAPSSQNTVPVIAPGNTQAPPQALPPGRIRVSSGVMAGQLIKRVEPVYTPIAKTVYVSGAVVFRVVIDRDGKVQELTPIAGPQLLRERAAEAVRQWEYKPYLVNGEPVEVETQITMNIDFGG